MRPFLGGGHMISRVEREHSTWNELPYKFEAGTSAATEAVGLGAAVGYLAALGMDNVRAHERELTAYALERLAEIEGITSSARSTSTAAAGRCVRDRGHHPHDIAELCDREAVCVRAGHHCAQPLMRCLGVGATARASFHVYNARDEVDRLVEALTGAREVFGSDGRSAATTSSSTTRTRGTSASDPHDLEWHDHNPLCGDELGVHVVVEDGVIKELRFHGQGCAISQAAASITSEDLVGMPVEEIRGLDADWVIDHLGIDISPTRRKCALLSLKVMRGATTGDASLPSSTPASSRQRVPLVADRYTNPGSPGSCAHGGACRARSEARRARNARVRTTVTRSARPGGQLRDRWRRALARQRR